MKPIAQAALGVVAIGLVTLAWLYQHAVGALCTPCDRERGK
jgi:hypothetical protein